MHKNCIVLTGNKSNSDTIIKDSIENLREDIIKTAKRYLGAKYSHGHSGPNVFDCSGFTSFVYRQFKINISRSCKHQYSQGLPVKNIADLKIGDLVFFGSRSNPKSIGHVGIVIEINPKTNKYKFIHASINGVRISPCDEKYYINKYIGARRIIAD